MLSKIKLNYSFNQVVSILCILSMVISGVPQPLAFASVKIQAGEEPERTRSNHSTQINVSGPSNIHINTWSGNLFYPVSILTIPDRGMSIDISMSYNSGWHDFATHYGHGWQLSNNMFYVRDENGDIIVVWEDGRADKFVKSNGSYLSPVDTYDTFREYRPGKYLLRTKTGKEFYFDSSIHKRLTKIQDPNGNALNFAYDSDMLLTTISDASGRQVNFAYTNSNLTGITDNIGRSIHFQYDANGNLTGITDALGNTTLYGYDAEHFLTSITDPLGNTAAIAYTDGAIGNVTGGLISKSFSYDEVNRTTTMTAPAPEGDQITRFFYDADDRINRIEYVKDSEGNVIFRRFNWDEKNNLIGVTDENGNTTTYTYDTMGNLLSVTDALGRTTQYVYENTYNKLISVNNANGQITTYEYDSLGNLIIEKDPLGNTTSYIYNDNGEVISKTDANGATTIFSYNDYGNLISETDPLEKNTSYSYDDVGNLTAMTSADASVLYTYDHLNRVANVNYVSHEKSISYTYDAVGNRKTMTDTDGGITTYTYDEANRLISLTNPLGQTTGYSYDSKGRLTRKDYHNGTYATYQYDRLNRLISLINKKTSDEVISSYTYEHDNVGNRNKMTEANGDETIYDYDDLYQLTSVTYPDSSTVDYAYDAVGNRLTLTDVSGTILYSYDAADRLLTAGTVTYGWDNNGNMISKTDGSDATSYTYDYKNRLISTTFPDGKINTFTYYPDGKRLNVTNKVGIATYYLYDDFNVLAETNGSGTTTARYTSAGIDSWISMDRGSSSYYYHKDGLGSVTGLTSSGEAVVATYKYDVFGSVKSQTGSIANPYLYTGRGFDPETKLYYYRTRYYESVLGRFLTPDSIGFSGGINFYTYVKNNPPNLIDPTGTDWVDDAIWVGIQFFVPPYIGIFIPRPGSHPKNWRNGGGKPNTRLHPPYISEFDERAKNWLDMEQDMMNRRGNSGGGYGGGGGRSPGGGGTGGGGTGGSGIESMPLMNIRPSYFRQPNLSKPNKSATSTIKTKLLNGISNLFLPREAFASTTSEQSKSDSLVSLTDIIPTEGPAGTEAVPITPSGPFEVNSNAVDAAAMDFVDTETSLNKATVYATKTISRTYDHDYQLCNMFHGYTMETADAVSLSGILPGTTVIPWFWHIVMTKEQLVEETFIFAVFVNEETKTFTVDSRWLSEEYPAPEIPDYDYVFNFQIWSSSSEEAYKLLRQTLANLSNFGQDWTVTFANIAEPVALTVLIKSAELTGNVVRITVQSWLPQTQVVRFCGFMRYPSDRENNVPFEKEISLEPGFNVVDLPLGNILDALIYIQVNDFTNKIYVGTGSWFSFADSASDSEATLILPNCAETTNLTSSDFILAGCAELTGKVGVNGWAGMARTLNPNDLPIDVSQYQALTFFARGDGKSYRVRIETDSVRQLDSHDFHQFVFTTSTEWRQFVIPLSSFSQRGWDPTKLVPFTGEDVISIVWESVVGPLESINLDVNGVAFINSTIISETFVLPDTNDVAGPYTVTTQVTDDNGIESVYLFYSLDGGQNFTSVTMTENGSSYSASIPGQPLGTEVWYYIQAIDVDCNVATDPVDIPYRFQVSEHPYLLVDDFADTDPVNVLDGDSGPYGSDSGSSILVYHDEDYVRLDYDVSATSSIAGYYTLLMDANVTPYSAVTFMIKGATGGEKARVGLRDNSLNETKIVLGEYLPDGITTSWQKVTIPLVAFTRVADWSNMENFNVDFENRIDGGAGIIYLDDIKFEYIAYIPVVVDNFNDMTGENGLGGWLWTWNGGGASINTDYDQTNCLGDSGAGYRISYSDVTGSAWALAVMDLTGLDASSYQTLSFYIKGADGDEQPNIYFVSKTDETEIRGFVDIEDYITVTSSWQRVNIPLEVFEYQGVDLSNLAYFQLGFEWGEMSGTIYLDNIKISSCDYDADGDGDVDGLDLAIYIETHEDFSDLSSFATMFGSTY